MTKSLRHALMLLFAICMVAACEQNYIPSDVLGTDGITQGKIAYDTIKSMRDILPPDTLVDPDAADTISVDEAVRIGMEEVAVGATSDKSYYVLGYVKGYYNPEKNKFDPNYGNICVTLTNKLNNRTFVCYRMLNSKGKKFDSIAQVQPGDVIVAYGKIQNYNNAPQMPQGCQLVTSDNPASGYIPAPITVFKESFNKGFGKFVIDNKVAAEGVDIWKHVEQNGQIQGYITANSEKTTVNAESWLISPAIDFSKCKKGVALTFNHYCQGKSAQAAVRPELARVLISKDDGATWEALTIDDSQWNRIAQSRFVAVSIDLSEYATNTCKIAFAYKSTEDVALAWAIQNVRIGEPEDEEE